MSKELFREKIKRHRLELGFTLQDVADKTDSSKSYIWEIENKAVNVSTKKLLKIANALKVTIDYLLDPETLHQSYLHKNEFLFKDIDKLSHENTEILAGIVNVLLEAESNKLECTESNAKQRRINKKENQ